MSTRMAVILYASQPFTSQPFTSRAVQFHSQGRYIYSYDQNEIFIFKYNKKVIFFRFYIFYNYHKSINILSIHIEVRQKRIICTMWICRVSSFTVKVYGTRSKWPRRRGLRSVWYNAFLRRSFNSFMLPDSSQSSKRLHSLKYNIV